VKEFTVSQGAVGRNNTGTEINPDTKDSLMHTKGGETQLDRVQIYEFRTLLWLAAQPRPI
jgi:hypothetical protein